MTLFIAPIVEGHTERSCLERLLQRVWVELLGRSERLQVLEPFRGQRDRLASANGIDLTAAVQKAFLKLTAAVGITKDAQGLLLLMLDADKDCPAALAPQLLARATAALPSNASIACVLPKREFENWIIAGASSLAGVNGLPATLPPVRAFEDIKGSGWIEKQLRSVDRTRAYKKTADSAAFVRVMNLAEAWSNSPSFRKLCRELEKRLPPPPPPTVGQGDDGTAKSAE